MAQIIGLEIKKPVQEQPKKEEPKQTKPVTKTVQKK